MKQLGLLFTYFLCAQCLSFSQTYYLQGTTSPTASLDEIGSMKANALFSKNGRIAADGTSNTYLQTNHVNRMTILNANGYVGIGTTNPHKELDVNGIVRAKEVKVETVPSLAEVKNHIETNKHLPGISTEVEVKENGVNLGEMQTKLLQKIEELTLYLIQQNEEIKNLKVELDNLKSNK